MRKDQSRQTPPHQERPARKKRAAETAHAAPVAGLSESLLDLDELCQLLHLGKTTISQLIKREGLPVHKFGRAHRFDRAEVRDWLQQRRHLL